MPTVERQIIADADDVNVYWDGVASWVLILSNTATPTGYYSATRVKRGGGYRFKNIPILNGVTIHSAYLEVEANNNYNLDTVNTVIIGELSANPAAFSDIANYQSRRGTICGGATDNNITTASVNWNNIAHWTSGAKYQSPDIRDIIQEIVDLSEWDSGNDIVLFWDDHGDNSTHVNNTYRAGYGYSDDPTKTLKLHIEYEDQKSQYIIGSPSIINRRIEKYLLGIPEVVGGVSEYLFGAVEIVNGHAEYMLGRPDIVEGGSNYLLVVPTIVARLPKPMYGRIFQRLSVVEKEVM